MNPTPHDLAALEALAVEVAREAAAFIVEQRPTELEVSTKSTHTDVVTVMDSRSQELISERLRTARPQDAFFGEEDGAERGGDPSETGLTWVVDPIDGTVNYLYGLAPYAVSVAVVEGDPAVPGEWRPVAGAVVDATSGEVFHAHLGGGSRRRGVDGTETELTGSGCTDIAQALVATGFGYDSAKRGRQARALVELLPAIRDIRRGGSAALDLCHVASGQVDGYYEMGVNAWDIAAAWLVITEAGGLLTGASGRPPSPDSVVAAGPGVHADLLALVDSVIDLVREDR
ncbi:MAG: inositol monophosphatase family protein [Mobilicoccus sp.]|nr:inositol monophosphatase family protein [Mobilicoccus sp.]